MKRQMLVACACLMVAACSSNSTTEESADCAVGEPNPVTGKCEVSQDSGSSGVEDSGSEGVEDTGSGTTPDGGDDEDAAPSTEDMSTNPSPDSGGDPDMGGSPEVIRFVAIGDQGTGSDTQRQVADSIGQVCTDLGGCDFGLLLGDNFYDSGVDAVDDSLFMMYFVVPYGGLGFPFYVVLGNHDLGGDGLGVDLDPNKADYQIDYSMMNPQWIMPAEYYEFTQGPLYLVGLNTTDIFFSNDEDQREDIPDWVQNAGNRWKIAFGHHPYISNGPHGNAGEYEGTPFVPVVNGQNVKDFMESVVCGSFDFYICGHDHSRQDLVETCDGTQFIVSGAGAKTTDLEGDNDTHFQADTEGFLLLEATDSTMKIQFYDASGTLEHTRMVTR
jgi:hypothetical protein